MIWIGLAIGLLVGAVIGVIATMLSVIYGGEIDNDEERNDEK